LYAFLISPLVLAYMSCSLYRLGLLILIILVKFTNSEAHLYIVFSILPLLPSSEVQLSTSAPFCQTCSIITILINLICVFDHDTSLDNYASIVSGYRLDDWGWVPGRWNGFFL
jgi:hypothetical protein